MDGVPVAGCGTFLDILIAYFAIVSICFPLLFFHRGLHISIKIFLIYLKVGDFKLKSKAD